MKLPKRSAEWLCPYFLVIFVLLIIAIDAALVHVHITWRIVVVMLLVLGLGWLCGSRKVKEHCPI